MADKAAPAYIAAPWQSLGSFSRDNVRLDRS